MIAAGALGLLAAAVGEGGGHEDATHAPQSPPDILNSIYGHLNAHPYGEEPYLELGGMKFFWTNHHLAILLACSLVFVLFGWLAWCRTREVRPRGTLQNLLEMMFLFVRDDLIYANMGKEVGRRFAPLFFSQFFCILFMNLFGILPTLPFMRHAGFPTTATANLWVTAGLASVTLLTILFAGMKEQGPVGYWKNLLIPHIDVGEGLAMKAIRVVIGVILFPIELMGLFIKPIALTIRLAANMTGGHLAMLTIYGLIYVFASYPLAGVGVAFNVFLTFLELLVALIQAFVFTYLSILFVGAAVHPEH